MKIFLILWSIPNCRAVGSIHRRSPLRASVLCLASTLFLAACGAEVPFRGLTTEEIYRAFLGEYSESKTFFHGHTYTANPLACRVALASLDLFRSKQVLERIQTCRGQPE